MKRVLSGIVPSLILVLACGSMVSAAPPLPAGEAGSFSVFGEYAPVYFYAEENHLALGGGYAITDDISAGLEAQFVDSDIFYGAFVDATLGPIALGAEFATHDGESVTKLNGLYVFDLGPVQLGAGGGMIFTSGGADATFVEAAGSLAAGDALSVYGKVDYYLDGPETTVYNVGVSYAL